MYENTHELCRGEKKLTVDNKYKNLILPLQEIKTIGWSRMIFPIAIFYMKSGEQYKFLIFNKRGFEKWYKVMTDIQTEQAK